MEQIDKNKKLLSTAKILRRNMTSQENHLWYDGMTFFVIIPQKYTNNELSVILLQIFIAIKHAL